MAALRCARNRVIPVFELLPVRRYEFVCAGGVVTTCPSFIGSVGTGLTDIFNLPSLPSSRYVTLWPTTF